MASHNLPLQLTSFVGRKRELGRTGKLLDGTRLLTLTGAGGVGKTRLALELAAHKMDRYKDGVWLIELGALFEPTLVVHEVTSTFGLRGGGEKPRIEVLKDFLHRKNVLLVLDNCEHLIKACAELAAELLQYCPKLQILATSREPLSVPGETVYLVPPLSIQELELLENHTNLIGSEAFQLFVERARIYQPSFKVDENTASAIAEICLLLEGIPLAVELAAARVRLLSPDQIAIRLKESLNYLAKGGRTVVSRQQTLSASLEWSYDLLTEREQMLFRRLAVFAGGFILQDVEVVCAGGLSFLGEVDGSKTFGDFRVPLSVLNPNEVFRLLSNLVDKSLIVVSHDREAIYRLLIPIKHFAVELLSESGEMVQLQYKHLYHYLELAEATAPKLKRANQSVWIQRLEIEHDNLRAALAYSLEVGFIEIGMRLALALGHFWIRRGYYNESLEWLNRLLNVKGPEDIWRARCLLMAGEMDSRAGNYAQARSLVEQGFRLCEAFEYWEGMAEAHHVLGIIEHYGGNRQKGIRHLKESLVLFREIGDEWHVAITLLFLGDAQMRSGDYRQAAESFNNGLKFFRKIEDKMNISFALGGLGDLARLQGDYDTAKSCLQESLSISLDHGSDLDLSWKLEALAIVAAAHGRYEEAVMLWGSGSALRETYHSPLPPSYMNDYAPYLATAKSALGEEAFQKAWERGDALSLEHVVEIALDLRLARPVDGEPSFKPDDAIQEYGLTRREVEVLRLVASGLSNPQVAEELVISPRTVSKHLESIYGKLQVNSRSAATRIALEKEIA